LLASVLKKRNAGHLHQKRTVSSHMQLGGIILPSELERAVFETAAFLDYNHIPRLLLVAHRVHTW
jgi:hypothetical protein